MMDALAAVENRATICRITCGWRKPGLNLDDVRRYWRDVHSPAIARRAGIFDYRHFQFGAVDPGVLAPVPDIGLAAPADAQLQWLSDVRYRDDAALESFGASPDPAAKAQLLQDIELIVDQSTTYKALGADAVTLTDRTVAAPQGTPDQPRHALFVRGRSGAAGFNDHMRALVRSWAAAPGVRRLRLSLLEPPDMDAERRGGYPIKTHPPERQYQAWIDLVVEANGVARALPPADATHVAEIHAYPVEAAYCFNYDGRPTLVGLRGFAGYQAINALGAVHARGLDLLRFMYGDHAQPGLQV